MSTATATLPVPTAMVRPGLPSAASGVLATAAVAGYLLTVVAANVVSVHWSPLASGGLLIPAGTVFAGMSLTLRDLVHDVCGPRGVAAGTVVGAGISATLASPQIAVASVVAFTFSEVLDAVVYARVRHRTRLGAAAVSNAVGLVVDTAVFVPLAFGDVAVVPGQIVGKTGATVCTLLALYAVGVARRMVRA